MDDQDYVRDIVFATKELGISPHVEIEFWNDLTPAQRACLLWIQYGNVKAARDDDYVRPIICLRSALNLRQDNPDHREMINALGERSMRGQFRLLATTFSMVLSFEIGADKVHSYLDYVKRRSTESL